MEDFNIVNINDKQICVGGVGKLFYQHGFPIGMSISVLRQRGIEVSVLHVIDECLKNGWSSKTTWNKIQHEIGDDIENVYDIPLLKRFCFSDYDVQREMIFNYLFSSKEAAIDFYKTLPAKLPDKSM